MRENRISDNRNFPPIHRSSKKPSFEFPLTKDVHDLTPMRKRETTHAKMMTATSMPIIGFDDHCYKYTLGEGNNHPLIRRVMNSRSWWMEIPSYNTLFNFNWQPTSSSVKYDRLKLTPFRQLVNHFEEHKELSSKIGLLNNLQTFCEDNQKFLFDILPITFSLDLDHLEKFDNEFQDFLDCFQGKSSFFKSSLFPFSSSKFFQKNSEKKHLLYAQPRNHTTLNCGCNIWILKPADYNRGRGIRLFNSLEELHSILQEYERYEFENYRVSSLPPEKRKMTNSLIKPIRKTFQNREELKKNTLKLLGTSKLKTRRFIIQKYIESPLLINQRKFDIRVWGLLTHEMKVFFFKEGYIRTSSEIFDLTEMGLENQFIHLTNNAIQKNSDKYGTFEKGNQLSFHQMDKYFRETNQKIRMRKQVVPKMKELISLSFRAVEGKLNPNNRKFCFEIFGFDFMIDSNYNLWLLEINTNPCIEESSPLLKQLIPRMLDDAFRLTVDVIFPPKNLKGVNGASSFRVNGYKDHENLWENICELGKKQTSTSLFELKSRK